MSKKPSVFVRSQNGRLPYSKGVMTQSLTATGLPPERCHVIASLIQERLRSSEEYLNHDLTVSELHEFVVSVLAEIESKEAADKFRRWMVLKRKDIPIIMLVGGTAGSGKSTVASQVASRLGITRVTSTDLVRQVMRAFFSPELMPVLHHSSFDVPVGGMVIPGEESLNLGLLGFLEQARQVSVGINAILDRAIREHTSILIEGVHLVPGLVQAIDITRSAVVEVVVYIDDPETHRSHFTMRSMQSDGLRHVDHYLRGFDQIREIQQYFVDQANRRGVPVIENTYLDETSNQLIDHVLDVVERVATDIDNNKN